MAISVLHTTASNATSVTIPSTTAGSCLVACIMPFGQTGAPSVTGVTLGGSADHFALAVQDTANGNAAAIIWADPNCAAGQTAVVISGANLNVGTSFGGVCIYEIAGLDLSAPVDQSNHSNAGTGSSWSSLTTPTTTSLNEIVIACANVSGTPSSPSGYTNTVNSGSFALSGQKIVSTTGGFIYNGTQTTGPWAAAIVTLKASLVAAFTKNVNVNQAVNRSAVW